MPLQAKLSIIQKTILILFGIFLSIIILEIGLRFGGFIFLSVQEYRNIHSLNQKSTCRILCLGESTTALGGEYSYPSQLERILNSANTGIKFSVINKGIPGTHTKAIVEDLPDNLNKYNPDIVITMIGINDQLEFLQAQDVTSNSKVVNFSNQLRVTKLIKFLWLYIKTKINTQKICGTVVNREFRFLFSDFVLGLKNCYANQQDSVGQEPSSKEDIKPDSKSDAAYVGLGWSYLNQQKLFQAEEEFKKALVANLQSDSAYVGLGTCYSRRGDLSQAIDMYNEALKINPKSDTAYTGLGYCYSYNSKFAQAEELYKKAIEVNPNSDYAYLGLGQVYSNQLRLSQAQEAFQKALKINPKSDTAYTGLGYCYSYNSKFAQAEELYKKAIEVNPNSDYAYLGLGWVYSYQLKFVQSEEAFKKALEINPNNYNTYVDMGSICSAQGDLSQAIDMYNKALKINSKSDIAYNGLGYCYMSNSRFAQAEEAFKKALEINSRNDKALGGLAELCQERGQFEFANEYRQKANAARLKYYNSSVFFNYLKLKDILDQRRVKFVCVQYPNRSIEPLKNIFKDKQGIIFVDNEKIFRDAIKKDGWKEYFQDAFAGDFGHCTPKGNRLLAENIAKAILKEVYNK
ncbi:MAG: tetratricopeptide repeat protein [Candidatus Omnitrophica bacterium]|nr:tetratricopeptide repeat protein [Candidatus Omnitrophota bacterium]